MTVHDKTRTKFLDDFGFKDPLTEKRLALQKRVFVGDEKMKAKVHEVVKLEDGKHYGKIINVEFREKPYEYVDVIIEEKETQCTIKAGLPFYISDQSALGMVLKNFGAVLKAGEDIDYADYLKVETDVEFLTKNKDKDGKTYCNIINDTLKPKQ